MKQAHAYWLIRRLMKEFPGLGDYNTELDESQVFDFLNFQIHEIEKLETQ